MNVKSLLRDFLTLNIPALRLRLRFGRMRLLRRLAAWRRHRAFDELDYRDIPVIINSFNTLNYLERLVAWLESAGMRKIILLDNGSTYPPLLEYYHKTRHQVIYLRENLGHRALWKSRKLHYLLKSYYVYTDPDVVPDNLCPDDVVGYMYRQLHGQFAIDKLGLSLRIDDLPDHFERKQEVIRWESSYWQVRNSLGHYIAKVDTTFALYAPYATGGGECKAWRTSPPYTARHLPWYEDSANPTTERIYYQQVMKAGISQWTSVPNVDRP
ncbi:MAG: glycosyltransferase family 2 protein [Candidatus Pollutiaquabacter aromativorans]